MARKNIKSVKMSHLALQGGGAHGAYAWGILDKLLEDGRIKIANICATSAGSMNAAIYAYGKIKGGNDGAREALHNFWYKISAFNNVFGPRLILPINKYLLGAMYNLYEITSHILSPYNFNPYNYNPLKDILNNSIDFEALKKCKEHKLFISATNVRTGKVKIFNNEDLSVDVLLASACLPNLFQAVKVNDEHYWDGGYSGNPAISPLFYNSDIKDVIVIHINPIIRSRLPLQANEIMNRRTEITFNSSLIKEFRAIAFVNKLLDEGWIKDKYKNKLSKILVHSIRADEALHSFDVSSKYDTDWNHIQRLRDLGRIHAKLWIEENFHNIGNCGSLDLPKFIE